jgi:hypothetical protein
MASIGWNFPSNNNGREDGLNDPGIETFRDNPLRSLSREIPQNSLDALDKSGKPVEVHFELINVPMSKFPDHDQFERILKGCLKYWEANEATCKFFLNALKVANAKTVRVLRASDYNTTGLLGPVDDRTSDWFKLTKAVGASDKAGGAGGSFGIGKHAPFACSELRTVLYGTKDMKRAFAFQGVSKLVTYLNGKGETTQGTGYYGVRAKNAPISDPSFVDKIFRRNRIGTDIFILGFLPEDDWADEIARGLVESFLVSIHEGRLLAHVGNISINQNSLPTLIEKYSLENPQLAARAYYEALTSGDASFFCEDDFEGLGRIELSILAGKDFPKRVAMVRSTGMKIYDKGHFQTPLRFAGVFTAKGEKLNALLKSLEPPSHDRWEDKRGEDSSYARTILKNLHGWIHDRVRALAGKADLEELDAEGISHYLPDDLDEGSPASDSTAEGERSEPLSDIPIQIRTHDTAVVLATGAANPVDFDEREDTVTGGLDSLGGDGETEGNGDGHDGQSGNGDGEETTKGDDGSAAGPTTRHIGLRKVRVYCSDPAAGRYRIICEPEETGKGFLRVHVIGEVGQEPAPIREVWPQGAVEAEAAAGPGRIGPLDLESNKRLFVDVVLEGALHCALGVSAYAG